MSGSSGGDAVAFDALNALTVLGANVRELADARWLAIDGQAFGGDLNVSVDDPGQRHVTRGHAIHLSTAVFHVQFAIRGAFGCNGRGGLLDFLLFALSGGNALAFGVS
jgi:hypothetical protein